MAFDAGKPALALRRELKQVCRVLMAAHTDISTLLREATALGINYAVDQGTYLADPDAAAAMTLLAQVQTFLQNNAPAITKGADIGDNII
jgi:hypothetical protein